ncbi:Unknown protein [Striga hermonthica]|uniref:Reverse transcriptase zinc-binding domain-containing protein n=1 Tax=Striga hermonthica TaxID=68872 RepID=A0A9N7N8H4_STRHE|nr:Unknown protein [Striga hermonthica]
MWKKTWAIKLKPKLKSFLWRCIHDSLPVAEKLHARGILPTSWCQICGEGIESLVHVLFHCDKAKKVWSIAPVSWNQKLIKPDNFKGWWSDLCNAKKGECWEDRVQLTVYILWWLWRTRNLCIFEKKSYDNREIIRKSSEEWREFAGVKIGPSISAALDQVGQICLFVSACSVPGMGSGFGCVAVIKNQNSMTMKWQVFLPSCYDVLEALLHGIHQALWKALLKEWKVLEVLVEDEAVARNLNNNHSFNGVKNDIADNIYILADLSTSCSFDVSSSDFICLASSLALEAISSCSCHEWLC